MSETSPGEAIFSVQSVTKSYGAQPVLQNVSLTVHEGERVGLVGLNGSGKSTLLKIISGKELPDEGRVTRKHGLRLALLDQDCHAPPGKTVSEALDEGCREVRALLSEHDQIAEQLADPALAGKARDQLQASYDALHHRLDLIDAWDLPGEIKRFAVALNLAGAERALDTLSGGELRRVDLTAILLSRPDVLLLDEPTNHIDTKSVEWIEQFLSKYRGSCLLVTHDRYFLETIVDRIVEIDGARIWSFPGNYQRFLEYKARVTASELRAQGNRQATLKRELAWLKRGPKARTTKQKARIRRYQELDAENGPNLSPEIEFEIPPPPRLSKRILEVEGLGFAYGDAPLFHDFSFAFQKKMRVGVMGPNGCGKTTLIHVLMGRLRPTSGTIYVGNTTEFLYIDQSHEEIDPTKSPLGFVSNGANHWDVNGRRMYVPAYLERLLFDMDSVRAPMGNLSGGERNRIELAKKLLRGGNFLVLDEPTNDLDLQTLRVLEDAVCAFDGCALIVSHDRYFLNRLCTHLIVFEEDGRLLTQAGNYEDYQLYKERKAAEAASARRRKTAPKQAPRARPNPGRLTYKGRLELAKIDEEIEAAESEAGKYESAIGEPGFYEQDYKEVQDTLAKFEAAKKHVDELYNRWHELEQLQNC